MERRWSRSLAGWRCQWSWTQRCTISAALKYLMLKLEMLVSTRPLQRMPQENPKPPSISLLMKVWGRQANQGYQMGWPLVSPTSQPFVKRETTWWWSANLRHTHFPKSPGTGGNRGWRRPVGSDMSARTLGNTSSCSLWLSPTLAWQMEASTDATLSILLETAMQTLTSILKVSFKNILWSSIGSIVVSNSLNVKINWASFS